MSTAFEQFFDGRIFVINVAARVDRMRHFEAMAKRVGFSFTRFEAVTGIVIDGRVNGNAGCTASHRALLELQIANAWPRMMVFEDDADCIYVDAHERFDRFFADLPPTWDLAYLGGGYAEPPIARVSPHVIRAGRLMTTSSYGITLAAAKKIAPMLNGVGPIDSLFQSFHREMETYIISPRCFVQCPSYSDLQEREMCNAQSMLSRDLEKDLA